ncbi:MAG TPA: hypothetical protein PLP26_06895 [Ilumatobacteraceae bacterium]|nr:hypothetical protein [Ilumatobacteraceae bacterium]
MVSTVEFTLSCDDAGSAELHVDRTTTAATAAMMRAVSAIAHLQTRTSSP